MNTSIRTVLALLAAACMGTATQAAVLTFEDLPAGGPQFFLADYNGFRFGTNNIQTTAWFWSDEVTPFYTPSSPTHYVATDFQLYSGGAFEATQGITSAADFVFNGAFFSGEGQIRYQLFNNGGLVYTSTDSAALADATPLFVSSGYAGAVDEVVILGKQGFYIMDDFTYNTQTVPVPEPGAVSLVLLAGFMGLVATRRKKA